MADGAARLYFDMGSVVLPADASASLAGVLGALHADPARTAQVSGYHDPSGDLAANEELAKQRAMTVRQWLVTNGIAEERIELSKPTVTTGDGAAEEARRVEVSVD
jgi:K(+)-stimulated pyrophosphate-energized sodium pump